MGALVVPESADAQAPTGVTHNLTGTVYICDGSDRIFSAAVGPPSIIAGNGAAAFADGPAMAASFDYPWDLAVTAAADGGMVFYVNGSRAAGEPYGATLPTSGDLWIGSAAWSPEAAFSGWIDELALFGRALSEPEIRQMYQAGRP